MRLFSILLIMNFFYAGTPAFMKLAGAELIPFEIVFFRHTLAMFCFLPFFLSHPQKKIPLHDFYKIMMASFFAFTFASVLQVIGMRYTNAADGSFIMAMEPLIVIFLAVLFLKENVGRRMLIGLTLTLLGFVILSGDSLFSPETGESRWIGNVFFLSSVVAEASLPVFLKPLLKKYPPLTIAFYALLCASLYLLPFQNIGLVQKMTAARFSTWVGLLYLGGGCSFLACFLWLVCLSRASASFVAISWFVQPLFGALFAVLLLNETLTTNIYLGGGLIFASLFLLTKKRVLPLRTVKPIRETALFKLPVILSHLPKNYISTPYGYGKPLKGTHPLSEANIMPHSPFYRRQHRQHHTYH